MAPWYNLCMSLFLRSEEKRSEYQEKLAEDLKKRLAEDKERDLTELPDGVKDSAFMKDFEGRGSRAGILLIIVIAVVIILSVLFAR